MAKTDYKVLLDTQVHKGISVHRAMQVRKVSPVTMVKMACKDRLDTQALKAISD